MHLPPEMWTIIIDNINDGFTWKSFIETCKDFYSFNNDQKNNKLCNPLWTLILKFPDLDWYWKSVSENEWTTYNVVNKYPNMPYNWDILTVRLIFPDDFLQKVMEFDINNEENQENIFIWHIAQHRKKLIHNKNISRNFMLKYYTFFNNEDILYNYPWEIIKSIPSITLTSEVCANDTINFEEIEKLNLIDFDIMAISNDNIPIWFIKKYINLINTEILSSNEKITVEFIDAAPNAEWDWAIISESKNAFDIFKKYPDKYWDFDVLSYNENITIDIVIDFPNKPWNMELISANGNISINDVYKYPKLNWDYIGLLTNRNIPLESLINDYILFDNGLIMHISLKDTTTHEFLENLHFYDAQSIDDTNLYGTLYNLSYRDPSLHEISEHPEIPWDYECLSYNFNLSWQYVKKNIYLLEITGISCNHFNIYK